MTKICPIIQKMCMKEKCEFWCVKITKGKIYYDYINDDWIETQGSTDEYCCFKK